MNEPKRNTLNQVTGSKSTGIPCQGWERPCESRNATRQRQDTKYVDDDQNWVTLCPCCMKANAEHWADVWADMWAD